MPNPATFEALDVEGYTPTMSNPPETIEQDGKDVYFERHLFELPNGFAVSIARTDAAPVSIGFEEGKWEAALMKPLDNPLLGLLTGNDYQHAPELEDLITYRREPAEGYPEGYPLVAPLDNAGIKALLDEVASRPAVERPEGADEGVEYADLDALFANLFGPVEHEEEQA